MKKTIRELNLKDKKVLIRVDFNVPIKNGVITSNKRILAALPTIKFAIESGAKVILMSHLSRIKTIEDTKTKSLKLVSEELSRQLKKPVDFVPYTKGVILESKINALKSGDVLMMENTRFEDLNGKAESGNVPALGKYWASLADVFVNDAFGTVHRAHASNVGISNNIKESCVGFLVQEELSMLAKAIYGNKRPFVAIIGGAKITDKIKVINNLIDKVDYLIIGGGMAYTFCAAQGIAIGSSLVEVDQIPLAKEYMKKYSNKIILPIDSAVSHNFSNSVPLYNNDNSLEIPMGYMGLDIGPKTIKLFRTILAGTKTVIWNGPMGVAEFDNYKQGTESIANIIAAQPDVFSIIGGGDSAAAIINLGLEDKFSHISTGGGASLQFLEGAPLPGIDAIQESLNSSQVPVQKQQELPKVNPIQRKTTEIPVVRQEPTPSPVVKPIPTVNKEPLPRPVVVKPSPVVAPTPRPVSPVVDSSRNTKTSFFGKLFKKHENTQPVQVKPLVSSAPMAAKPTPVVVKSEPTINKTPIASVPAPTRKTTEIPVSKQKINSKTETTKINSKTETTKIKPTNSDVRLMDTNSNIVGPIKPAHIQEGTQSIRPAYKPTESETKRSEKIAEELKVQKTKPINLQINRTAVVNEKTGKVSIVREMIPTNKE